MYRKKLIKPYVFPIAVLLIVIITGLSANKIARIYESADNLKIKLRDESIHWKDIDQRTREWFTAIQIIKEKPVTGAGYFLIKDKLLEKYLENGFFEEALQLMNAHNQYLEAQMTFGIAGSISLLMMLLIPLIYRKQIRYPRLMTIFIAMVSFFLMFESMFNRQWGIMFFLLFYCILCLGEENVNI
jgi:O-antigen ligase